MANKFAALLVFSVLALYSSAASPLEVDFDACTKSASNMMGYCQGYCELQTNESCDYDWDAGYPTSEVNSGAIDRCVCKCGVSQDRVAYDSVPCGVDLMRKWSPGDTQGSDYSPSFCCIPAFGLLAVLAFSSLRQGR